jgi:ribonucleotide reductase alpha subunit
MKRTAIRSRYIDQSSSLNIHLDDNSNNVLRAVFMTGYDYMLKTGSYYIRTNPAVAAMKTNIAEVKVAAEISADASNSKGVGEDDKVEACAIGCTNCHG